MHTITLAHADDGHRTQFMMRVEVHRRGYRARTGETASAAARTATGAEARRRQGSS
jgi:hypothetical protein